MAQAQTQGPARPPRRSQASKRSSPAEKVAITVRLDEAQARRLQAIAQAENRTLTNYVETALIRDLALRDEMTRVITMRAAPGASDRIAREQVVRGDGESDHAYARRQDLLTTLWSIPDSD